MNEDPFHQSVLVEIPLGRSVEPGELNRVLKSLGARLHYDVYDFARPAPGPIWQSEELAHVDLFLGGREMDAQDGADEIRLCYPLARIGAEHIALFVELAERIAGAFESTIRMNGESVTPAQLTAHLDDLVSDLMRKWGEEPGSEVLAAMIEMQYR